MDSGLKELIGCKKFAILGGTFDPVHLGHIETAKAIINKMGMEKILLLPSGNPPHKDSDSVTDSIHRLNMLKIAVENDSRLVISTMEIDRGGKTYTVDTIAELRKVFGNDVELFFIMGADAIHYIRTWKSFDRLLKMCSFIAVTRPHYNNRQLKEDADNLIKNYSCRIEIVEIPAIDVSSSEIRFRIKNGMSVENMVSDGVIEYINKNGLYK